MANDTTTEIDRELDDCLGTWWLVRGNDQLANRLSDQLVDLLLERILCGLRQDLVDGKITAAQYANELAELAHECRTAGLLSPER